MFVVPAQCWASNGITSDDSSEIVAVSHFTFDAVQKGSDPNSNPLCGRMIRARRRNEESGRDVSVDLKVVDRCKCLLLRAVGAPLGIGEETRN